MSFSTFPISAVSRLSGVPAETIRIWERRYGFLRPARSEGGHRLYDEDGVRVLRAVRILQEHGSRVGSLKQYNTEQLIELASAFDDKLLKPISSWGIDPIDTVIDVVDQVKPEARIGYAITTTTAYVEDIKTAAQIKKDSEEQLTEQWKKWRAALVNEADPTQRIQAYIEIRRSAIDVACTYNSAELEKVLQQPLSWRSQEEVALELYLPLLFEVGELWHEGRLPIAVEHLVEKSVTGCLHTLVLGTQKDDEIDSPTHEYHADGSLRSNPVVICACPTGERHEVGLLTASMIMRGAGWRVSYLGADLPADDILRAVQKTKPFAIVLAMTMELSLHAKEDVHKLLSSVNLEHVHVILGGMQAPTAAKGLSARVNIVENMRELAPTLAALRVNATKQNDAAPVA